MVRKKTRPKFVKTRIINKGGKNIALPKGYTAITGGGFAPSWEFKKDRSIQGVFMGAKKIKRNKPKKGQDPFFYKFVIKTDAGMVVEVFEKASLRALRDVKKGQKVFIGYQGTRRIKGRAQPMHDFVVGVR